MKLQYITNQSNNIKSESKTKWQFVPILDLKSYNLSLTDRRGHFLLMETVSKVRHLRQDKMTYSMPICWKIFSFFVGVVRLNKPMRKIWNKSNISIHVFWGVTNHSGFKIFKFHCRLYLRSIPYANFSLLLHFLQGGRLEPQAPDTKKV